MKPQAKRLVAVLSALFGVAVWLLVNPASYETVLTPAEDDEASEGNVAALETGENGTAVLVASESDEAAPLASEILERLEVKGRTPKTGYAREEFYSGWPTVEGCNLRQRILKREFGESAVLDGCDVVAGEFVEPYTGQSMKFTTKAEISKALQIDHVVALSDAWQKGAQYMDKSVRREIATDPLNLLAVDGPANEQKSDGDAATWLPPNKVFRCQYVARQVSVKYKYKLWVTAAEKEAISKVLENCPNQRTVGVVENSD